MRILFIELMGTDWAPTSVLFLVALVRFYNFPLSLNLYPSLSRHTATTAYVLFVFFCFTHIVLRSRVVLVVAWNSPLVTEVLKRPGPPGYHFKGPSQIPLPKEPNKSPSIQQINQCAKTYLSICPGRGHRDPTSTGPGRQPLPPPADGQQRPWQVRG